MQALMKRFRPLCLLLVAILLLEMMSASFALAGDEVIVRNVRFESTGQVITVFYDLQGPAENSFRVKVLLKRKQDSTFVYVPRSVTGDVGEGQFVGTNRQIVWKIQEDPGARLEGSDFYFVVEAEMVPTRTSVLWYIGGGAAVVAGVAALIFGKGAQSGTTPTDVFPKPIGRPGGN